jgi:hypothetical protein
MNMRIHLIRLVHHSDEYAHSAEFLEAGQRNLPDHGPPTLGGE